MKWLGIAFVEASQICHEIHLNVIFLVYCLQSVEILIYKCLGVSFKT